MTIVGKVSENGKMPSSARKKKMFTACIKEDSNFCKADRTA